jgi:SAM-dependent methyltransferase
VVKRKTPNEIYRIPPIKFVEGIPVFSKTNEYIENYERLSLDHVTEMEKTGRNPFIPEDLWIESENSTKGLILKYAEKGHRILDVGVGLGRLLSLLPSSFKKYGMDISMNYLKIAQSKGIDVCYALAEDMPYKKDTFDIVVCTDVLEHVLNLNLICNKILSVLKGNGILIVRVPYREDLNTYLSPSCPYKFAHLRSFDEYSLRLLFEKVLRCETLEYQTAGYYFGCIRLKYTALPLYVKAFFNRLISSTRYINKRIHRYLLRIFYNPVEINIVIRKPAPARWKRIY